MIDATSTVGNVSGAISLTPKAMPLNVGPHVDIDKTAEDFEAMFATQMLQPMFEGIGVDSIFGGGHGEEVMRSFMLQEYGKEIAKSGRFGIAAQVKAEMLRAQEGADARKSSSKPSSVSAKTAAARNAYANANLTAQGMTHVSH